MVTGTSGGQGVPLTGGGCSAPGPVTLTPHANLANVQYPTDIGAAFFTQERKRTGGLVNVQCKPSDAVNFDLSGFYSDLDAPNYNRNYLLWVTHFINQGAGAVGACGKPEPCEPDIPGPAAGTWCRTTR